MKDKNALNNELKGLSSLLHDLKRQGDGFRLPEGYFETLEDSVFSRIDALGARRAPAMEARSGGLIARLYRPQALAIAAALALVLAAVWFFATRPAEVSAVTALELSEEDIEAYVLENIRDFDAAQLVALSPEEMEAAHPAAQPENQPSNNHSIDDLSEEELELLLKEMSDEELESLL